MVTASFRKDPPSVQTTDTVIIGHGPSALFLSYLLHGHVPFYNPNPAPHPDEVLHKKLLGALADPSTGEIVRSLYDAIPNPDSYNALTSHFEGAQSMSYATQALPLNVLMDTLLRPLADIAVEESPSRVRWSRDPSRSVDHMVLGREDHAGGQWAGKEVWFGEESDCSSSDEDEETGIRTLSYAEMLSLPGYSINDHHRKVHRGRELPPDVRPTRRLVADYYAAYPSAVGISDAIHSGVSVLNVQNAGSSSASKYLVTISSRSIFANEPDRISAIYCNNVVLASGIFSNRIPAPPSLQQLTTKPCVSHYSSDEEEEEEGNDNNNSNNREQLPLLVIGSGYTAADVILSQPKTTPILHVYRWRPEIKSSPLKGCHPQVYPLYARVYRRMRETALGKDTGAADYEGCPNGVVSGVDEDGYVNIVMSPKSGENTPTVIKRKVSGVQVCVGRRGRIDYLSRQIRDEIGVVPPEQPWGNTDKMQTKKPIEKEVWVRSNSLRSQVEKDFEVAPDIFAVGSLTGDSLVRFSMGGCVYAAGKILANAEHIVRSEPIPIPITNSFPNFASVNGSVHLTSQLLPESKFLRPALGSWNSSPSHPVIAHGIHSARSLSFTVSQPGDVCEIS